MPERSPSGTRPRQPSAAGFAGLGAVLTCLLLAPAAGAQVIAHPNQIRGTVTFSNSNPAILAILDDPGGRGLNLGQVDATSLPPQSPDLTHRASTTAADRLAMPYELTVESGAPGAGIRYRVEIGALLGTIVPGLGLGRYSFAGKDSAAVEYEPAADVTLDIAECAAIIHFAFHDALGRPAPIGSGQVSAYPETSPGSGIFSTWSQSNDDARGPIDGFDFVLRGDGTLYHVEFYFATGSDPYLDLLSDLAEVDVRVGCDEIIEVPILVRTIDPTGTGGGEEEGDRLGKIAGLIDMLGEVEHPYRDPASSFETTQVVARDGPLRNYRLTWIPTTPSSGRFELPNLMPSDEVAPAKGYQVSGRMSFRTGHRYQVFTTPYLAWENGEVLVPDSPVVDLGDTFVIDPGTVAGDILLVGPEVGAASTLADLYRKPDSDGDGIPDGSPCCAYGSNVRGGGNGRRVPGAAFTSSGALAGALFEGSYDPVASRFTGDYELVLGGLAREASAWTVGMLQLDFRDLATPAVPESYQDCRLRITERIGSEIVVTPGSRTPFPLHYCMSTLYVRYHSEGASFTAPYLRGSGEFTGVDFEGRDASYAVTVTNDVNGAHGTPLYPTTATDGLVVMTLPQGRYTFEPHISSGGSDVELNPVSFEVGCQQIQDLFTDLTIDLAAPAACTAEPTITLTGRVAGERSVERIEYSVNGDPPIEVCAPCGLAPGFEIIVALSDGDNLIAVTAVDDLGRRATIVSRVERIARPADYGNVLLGVRDGIDARFFWSLRGDARATELMRASSKPFPTPTLITTVSAPGLDTLDRGAVDPTLARIWFYRVRGINCPGEAGP